MRTKICTKCDLVKRRVEYYSIETDPICKNCWDVLFGPKIILVVCVICNKNQRIPRIDYSEKEFVCFGCVIKRSMFRNCPRCNKNKHIRYFEDGICKKCTYSTVIDGFKKCIYCKTMKPVTDYYGKKKLQDYCKPCHIESVIKSNKKNIKRVKAYYKMTQRSPNLIYSIKKANAKEENINFTITKEEFLTWYAEQTLICHYCGIAQDDFSKTKDGFLTNKANLSLDRKDNLEGYELSNLVLSCNRCNMIKGNFFSYEEMKVIGFRHVRKHWHEKGIKTHRQGFKVEPQ